jgi:hypothetical protein
MHRRASLSIGTNAIVVLIIAIILLGIIVGLVTTTLRSVEERFLDQIENLEPEPSVASAGQPVTLSSNTKRASAGDWVGLKVSVFNPTDSDVTTGVNISCNAGIILNPTSNPRTLAARTADSFTLIFQLANTAPPQPHLCTISPTSSDLSTQADFTITVTN